ncbi:MAG: DUF6064 family protein [Candidatus Marinimicrobia bacterium]|nr:DUF6064 family protein [Candidatus Neomarinimicrobiota bacterium]MCF7829434.1 DUF6064 family protein [Candidatus Neomarinimicrobiota bacterium]MCF7880920.1 DUF6064 family protein [Candidatus Neomarinimicrobiota bacterium]
MNIPFTSEEFIKVIVAYNQAVWPMQIILVLSAFILLALIWRQREIRSRIVSGIIGGYWLWMGIAYHWIHFTAINKAAWGFGALFVLQGALFMFDAGFSRKLQFSLKDSGARMLAWVFFAYALIIYPVLGTVLGHPYPELPTFGLPCPTTIFTFGILLTAIRRVPVHLLIIPGIWSLIGFGAALNFGIYEDIGLLVAGIVGTLTVILRNRNLRHNR